MAVSTTNALHVRKEGVLRFWGELLAFLEAEAANHFPGHAAALNDLVLGLVIVGARGVHSHDFLDGDHIGVFLVDDQAGRGFVNGRGREGVNGDRQQGHCFFQSADDVGLKGLSLLIAPSPRF